MGLAANMAGVHAAGNRMNITNATGIVSSVNAAMAGPLLDDYDIPPSHQSVLDRFRVDNPDGGYAHNGFGAWVMPLCQTWNTYGMEAGSFDVDTHGGLGGLALGFDFTANNSLRLGLTFNLGGGYAQGSGDLNASTNSMNFWGAGLYAGYKKKNFGIFGDVSYTSITNHISQELPDALKMGNLSGDVQARVLSLGISGEYTFNTEYVNITPHAGVRYAHIATDPYEFEANGTTVIKGKAITQNIWSFPVGVTFGKTIELENGWTITPSVDLRVTPNVGDLEAKTNVRFPGVTGSTSTRTQTMDPLTCGGTLGIDFVKDNISVGLKYNIEVGAHSTQQGIFGTFRWEF